MSDQNSPQEPQIIILTPSDPRYAEVKRRMEAGEIKLESLADSVQDLTRSIHKRDRRLVGYYASWTRRTRGFLPEHVRGDLLTHLNYAFAVIDPSTLTARSADAELDAENFASLLVLKQHYPHLKVLLSIGGWTDSGYFSDMALSPTSRERFIQSCCEDFLDAYPGVFDGFDLDWEYPVSNGLPDNHRRPEDKANFTALVREFRQVLDARSSEETQRAGQEVYYFLTAALPAGLRQLQDSFELRDLNYSLDWINLMTYDYHGQWEKLTDFNAPLYHPADLRPPRGFFSLPQIPNLVFEPYAACIETTVRWITETQLPPYRLVLGLPFYGRAWQLGSLSDPEAHGYAQPAAGPVEGSFDYREIVARCLGRPGFTRYWHAAARVPWLYHAERGLFISYDDPESLQAKVAFAMKENLGGVMIWELSGDDGSLLPVVHQALQPHVTA